MSIRNVLALTQHLCSILGPSCTLARAHMLHPWPTLMHARICTPTPTGTGGACAHTCSSAQLINSAVGNCAECLRLRVDWQFRRRFHEPPERCPVVFVGLRGDIKHHIGRRGRLSACSGRVMNPHSNASQTVYKSFLWPVRFHTAEIRNPEGQGLLSSLQPKAPRSH